MSPYVVGYSDRFSVASGERIRFYVSAEGCVALNAEIVPLAGGAKVHPERVPLGTLPARKQELYPGSHAIIEDGGLLDGGSDFTVVAMICPTSPLSGEQVIMGKWDVASKGGYALLIDAGGCAAFWVGDGRGNKAELSSHRPMLAGVWYFVGCSYEADTGVATVFQEAVVGVANGRLGLQHVPNAVTSERVYVSPGVTRSMPFVIAGATEMTVGNRPVTRLHFNGKIDCPRMSKRVFGLESGRDLVEGATDPATLGAWDFSAEISRRGIRPIDHVTDRSHNQLHGRLVNLPTRGVTGHNWSGHEHHFANALNEYGAIHFHDDDVADADWDVDVTWLVPDGQPSGVYGLRLVGEGCEDHIPFIVRPLTGSCKARVAMLLPTNTYIAYGNDHLAVDGDLWPVVTGRSHVLGPYDLLRHEHREFGSSLYDEHSDGSGVCYASWKRPLLNLRAENLVGGPADDVAGASTWGFSADVLLMDWLQSTGIQVDLICDHDLASEGLDLLRDYRVVITGSHPEYYTSDQLDAFQAYVATGGRLMYLGGNGFYWVTAYHPDDRGVIEIRRWGGTETWTAAPGEYYLSFTGELGGLWRNRGRPPQKLVGVGFIAQGGDTSTYYRRLPDSFDPDVAWIFEGVEGQSVIGDFGSIGGGAAGLEIDSYDPDLGSPIDAYVLATSEDHTQVMIEVRENIPMGMAHIGGDQNPNVHADLVYFTLPSGGAIFSTGSIAWSGSLAHNRNRNDVAQITRNVLERFMSERDGTL